MKIMIIGKNAKEQAAALAAERLGNSEVVVVPGSAGTRQFEQSVEELPLDWDPAKIEQCIEQYDPDLVMVMDEKIVHTDIKKKLEKPGRILLIPDAASADFISNKLEWCSFLKKKGLPVADFQLFHTYNDVRNYIQENGCPLVLKQTSGNDVFAIPYDNDEAEDILDDWFENGDIPVMVSDFYEATRFNIPVLMVGGHPIFYPAVLIERGIYEEEDDAQAKGMGAICPANEILGQENVDIAINQVIVPIIEEMKRRGIPYTGYFGAEFVLTDEGPVCVNLKNGFSETGACAMFALADTSPVEVLKMLERGEKPSIDFLDKYAVSIVLAANGYPQKESHGAPIRFDEDLEGILIMNHVRNGKHGLETDGGRVLIATAVGNTLQEAADNARTAASHVQCEDLFYRTDIGNLKEDENLD